MEQVELDREWWKVWKNRRYILALMTCLGMINMYTTRINLSVAIVAMTETSEAKPEPDFDWTPQMKGYVLSSFFYGYAVMQVPSGVLTKYVPANVLFGLGVLVSAILTALMPLIAQNFALMIASRVVMGLFQAACVPCIMNFVSNWAPPLERSRLQTQMISGAFLGTVIVYPLSGFVGQNLGWEWIFYVTSALAFLWCVVWAICIRSTPEKDPKISMRELDYIRKSIGVSEKTEKKTPPIPWRSILTSVPIWAMSLSTFCWAWGYYTMLTQLPAFLKQINGFDLAKNGLISSLPYLTMTLMSLVAGYCADKLLVSKTMNVSQVRRSFISTGLAIQMIFILIPAYVVLPSVNIVCISVAIGFGAFTYSGVGVNSIDLAPAFSPILGGIGNTFGTMAGIISPILTGHVVTAKKDDLEALKTEWQTIFFVCAAIYIAGAVIYWLGGTGELQAWSKVDEDPKKEPKRGFDNLTFENKL